MSSASSAASVPEVVEAEPKLVTFDIPRDGTCEAAASVMQSAADTGHPRATFRAGDVSLQLATERHAARPSTPGSSQFFFRRDGQIEILPRRQYAPLDVVRSQELPAAVSDWCGGKQCLEHASIACEQGAPLDALIGALVALAKSQPKMAVSFARDAAAQRPWVAPAAVPTDVPLPLKRKARRSVRVSSLTTSESLSVDAARPALDAQLNDLESCYEETAHQPAARLMKVELQIGKKGGVMGATIRGDDLIDYDLECLYRALARAEIPAPSGGRTGSVTAGFAFTRAP